MRQPIKFHNSVPHAGANFPNCCLMCVKPSINSSTIQNKLTSRAFSNATISNSENLAARMIPDTILYLIFIRLSILGLRLVLPLCITYSILRLLDLAPGLPLPVEIIIYAEIIFYFLISLPRQLQLNNSAPHTTLRTRQERQDLFEKSLANIPDLEACLTTYFRGANLRDVHREDLKDFLAWMVMYKKRGAEEDQEELEAYARVVEIKLGWEFVGWRGRTRPSQCSIDRMRVRHKPLVFYVVCEMSSLLVV